MTDVVLSEPADTQSLMSIARDVQEGGGAMIPASHPARVRKMRPPQLKGKRVSDLVDNRSVTHKPAQFKDYLSEQRAKRLSKQKVRGRDGAKKNTAKILQQEKPEEEGEGEGVKEDTVTMKEDSAAESRLPSAESDSSKDEGISSNGEKDEDFETEAKTEETTDDTQGVSERPDEDDDEGRGSIKDENEEPPDHPDAEVAAEDETGENLVQDVPAGEESEPTPEEDSADPEEPEVAPADPEGEPEAAPADPEGEPEAAPADPEGEPEAAPADPEGEPEAAPADPEGEPEAAPADPDEEAEVTPEGDGVAALEEEEHPEDDNTNGYQGDMDEPNSLAASQQEVIGLSDDSPINDDEGAGVKDEENADVAEDADGTVAEEKTEEQLEAPEEVATDDVKEEIKEVPALAKVPRRNKSKSVKLTSSKKESEAVKTPRKMYDVSKVLTNRKPISWRPGPIQATSNKTGTLRPHQKKFKAKKPTEVSIKIEEPEAKVDAAEAGNEGGRGELSGEADGTELALPLNLDTFRSEGHIESLEDDETPLMSKSESLPELEQPSATNRRNKTSRKKKVRARINSTWKKKELEGLLSHRASTSRTGPGASTSEVWVPDEDRLYVYTYSSEPRLLHVRRMGSRRGVVTTDLGDHDPNSSFRLRIRGNGNPMYDRRVVRGSNYAKRFGGEEMPKWNPYFTNARSLENIKTEPETQVLRRQEFREKLEARARLRRESHGLASLYPSHTPHARPRAHFHAHAQTENYYEPLERPPEAEVGIQTESWGEEGLPPPVVFHSPPSVDASTQLYVEEDGTMALAALVARTMREAAMEVLMEERAEEERLTRMKEEYLRKAANAGEEQQANGVEGEREDEAEGREDEEDEERKDPEGKETSPSDTEEPARSPEPSEDLEKNATLADDEDTPEDVPQEAAPESEPIAV